MPEDENLAMAAPAFRLRLSGVVVQGLHSEQIPRRQEEFSALPG